MPGSDLTRRAVANLRRFLQQNPSKTPVEVVDVLADPSRTLRNRVFVTPTLICRRGDRKPLRLVGDLQNVDAVARHLESSLQT